MEIVWIRHTSVEVPQGTCYGQTDVPLKASFTMEAETTYKEFQRVARGIERVYTSPMSRCRKLAAYCGFPDAIEDARLLELDFGDWEMQRFEDIKDPRLQLWYEDYLHVAATNGESFQDQYTRVCTFIEALKRAGMQRVAVFTHGGVIRCAELYAHCYGIEESFMHPTPYGGVVSITF